MNTRKAALWSTVAIAMLAISGCATKTIVVPKPVHVHKHQPVHVVHHVRPAKKHCWRHRGHWDCR